MPSGTLACLASGLREHGAGVDLDVEPARGRMSRDGRPSSSQPDFRAAVTVAADELRQAWRTTRPDVVHAVGYVATAAAVRASDGAVPVVGTFYQANPWHGLEHWLAARLDGLATLSRPERIRWQHTDTHPEHLWMVPPAAHAAPEPRARRGSGPRLVVTDAVGDALDGLVTLLPDDVRLVVVGSVPAARIAAVCARAEERGILDRVDWRPGLTGVPLARQVAEADLVVAVEGRRDGSLVTQAAAAETPAVAVDGDVHSDLVVNGATGLLVPAGAGAWTLGEAMRQVLADPLLARGFGAAARVRVEAVQSPGVVAARALEAYAATASPAQPGGEENLEPGTPVLGDDEWQRLATEFLPLARQLAHRYAGRGQPLEDLVQVASLGLVKAAQRFDPEHGTPFPSYAVPTIRGELRRHFRDHAWSVRVPRTLQETTLQVERATQELNQTHGGEATVQDVADHLGLSDIEVLKARQASGEAFAGTSLDHPLGPEGSGTLGDLLGEDDPSLEVVELRVAVAESLSRLPDREREILMLRFFGDRTQAEIAEHLGMSQVHVSRTLTRTLAALRDHVLEEAPLPHRWVHRAPPEAVA
jgi:RNA polymerase sigma-B factor